MKNLFFVIRKNFSESMANTFKSRSKLFEFYKHTHPDVLSNAPEKIREENLRSLKMLNSYLDNLAQNKGSPEQHLKFYIAEKSNKKTRKYFFFDASLEGIKENMPTNILNNHIEKCINVLLENLKSIKMKADPTLKKEAKKGKDGKEEKDAERNFFDSDQYSMKPMEKNSTIFEERLNKKLESQFFDTANFFTLNAYKNNKLLNTISNELYYFDKEGVKPMLWSKILMRDTIENNNLIKFYDEIIDPRMIYLDKNLKIHQIEIFKKTLIKAAKTEKDLENRKKLKGIFYEMETSQPAIFLFVSDEFSATKIPGYLVIPYDFKIEELLDFYDENSDILLDSRTRFEESSKRVEKMKESIKNFLKIKSVAVPQFKNNEEIEAFLILLKLLIKSFTDCGHELQTFRSIVVSPKEETRLEEEKLYINSENFKKDDLLSKIKKIS